MSYIYETYEDKIKRMNKEGERQLKRFDLYNYQKFTRSVAVYPKENAISYLVTGLCAEAGEVADKYAKSLRGDKALDVQELLKEVGDVVWFCTRLADEYGYDLSLVLENNMSKLQDRLERNKLKGSGDNR